MKKYKSIIIAILLVSIHIFIISIIFKKPSYNNEINKNKKQNIALQLNKEKKINRMINDSQLYYVPTDEEGCIRSDKKLKKIGKNYQKLINDPYLGAIVIDADSGKILFEDHSSAFGYPASITKLMTLLITC